MAKLPRIKSKFAILDVTAGRRALAKYFAADGEPVPVVIYAKIVGQHGSDDGVSIEFELAVSSLHVIEPGK